MFLGGRRRLVLVTTIQHLGIAGFLLWHYISGLFVGWDITKRRIRMVKVVNIGFRRSMGRGRCGPRTGHGLSRFDPMGISSGTINLSVVAMPALEGCGGYGSFRYFVCCASDFF